MFTTRKLPNAYIYDLSFSLSLTLFSKPKSGVMFVETVFKRVNYWSKEEGIDLISIIFLKKKIFFPEGIFFRSSRESFSKKNVQNEHFVKSKLILG